MSYLLGIFSAQHDCYYVETTGAVLDVVGSDKVTCSPKHPGFLGFCHGRLGWAEILIRPGLDLYKNKRPVTVDHNQIDFASLAGKITGERFETFAFEEFLAAFLAPSAEQLLVRQQPAFVWKQFSYQLFRIDLAILRWCGRCAAVRV